MSSTALVEEEKSVLPGSLTERRPLRSPSRSSEKQQQDDYTRTLKGMDDLTIRNVIPTPPVRSTPFQLDQALSNLESQLTGINGSSGLTSAPAGAFAPTNFYIQWPPPSHVVSEEQRRLNGGGNYKNNWISPRQLMMEKTLRPKTAAEFPSQLKLHTQMHQPGLMGYQGDISLEDEQAINPRATRVGGAAARHFTGRIINDAMAETTAISQLLPSGAKQVAGPGSYAGPITPADLARSTSTFKPKPPKKFDDRGLIQGPAPGSYNPHTAAAAQPKVAAHFFGGTQKTHSRSNAMANQTGAVGTDPGGPGYYEMHEPHFGGEPTSQIFLRSSRFNDPSNNQPGLGIGTSSAFSSHSPGPGQYNISASAMGSIGAGKECVSFSARGGSGSAAAAAASFKRANGPAVGSYNPTDGGDIGASSLIGTSSRVKSRPSHKFAGTPRFDYNDRPHPLYALVVNSARNRSQEFIRNFKPDLSEFQRERREQILEKAKEERKEKQLSAAANRQVLRSQHLQALDKVIHRDLYRQQEREAKQYAEFLTFVKRGWLFYIALASRMHVIKENIRRVRTAKNLRLLTTKAARTIVNYAKRWSQKAHAKRVKRSAEIICRALRRNVVRASLKRKRASVRMLTILLMNQLNKTKALDAIQLYKAKAIKIQRAIRAFLAKRACAHELLIRQWNRYEHLLATKYKTQEGERSFEKIRKKGLLIKNMSLDQQRAKIIKEIPFDYIETDLKTSVIQQDYALRLKAFKHAKYEFMKAQRQAAGLPPAVSIIDAARAAAIKREKEAAEQAKIQQQLAEKAAADKAAAAAAGGSRSAVTSPRYGAGTQPSAASVHAAAASSSLPASNPSLHQTFSPLPSGPSPTQVAYQISCANAAAAIAAGLPPYPAYDPANPATTRPPYFFRFLSPLRLYSLLTSAQAKQTATNAEMNGGPSTMDPELKKTYKKHIGAILKAIQAREAKERKLKEKERLEREKEKEEEMKALEAEKEERAKAIAGTSATSAKPAGASSMSTSDPKKKQVI